MSRTAAILLAAGSGARMQGRVADKVLAPLGGRPLFSHSAATFLESGVVDYYVVVYRDQRQMLELSAFAPTPATFVKGGRERQDSVAQALAALPPDIAHVFIHDCARPFIRPDQLVTLHKIVRREHAVVLAHRVTDTIKLHHKSGRLGPLKRDRLWAMETPQAFSFPLIRKCYEGIRSKGLKVTDDTAAVSHYDYRVTIVENHYQNPKITHPEDLALAELLLQQRDQTA